MVRPIGALLVLAVALTGQTQSVSAETQTPLTGPTPAAAVGPTLTLAEADAIALKNHPRILGAGAAVLRSDELVREQRAAFYPTLNGNITASQAELNSRIGAGILTDSRLFNRFGAGVTLSQLITDSGRTGNLVGSSKLQAQASRADAEAVRDDIILAVHEAYYGVLMAESLVDLARQTVETRQTSVDQVNQLAQAQLKSNLDLNFAQVNLSDARLMQLRANNNLAGAYANLSQALGTSQPVAYRLVQPQLPPAPPGDPEPLIHQAFQIRPELRSLRFNHESDQKFEQAERDLRRPTVTLTGVGGVLPYINSGNANAAIPLTYEGAAVNVEVPIFSGHLFSVRERAAAEQVEQSKQRIRDLENRVARDIRTAQGRAETAQQAIDATQRLLDEANSALELAQGRYNLGLSSIVELTQAQLSQTQAQVEHLNAQFEYQQAYTELEYQQGLLH